MNILLDTHILLWHLKDDPKLEIRFSRIIEDGGHAKYLSLASLWEVAIKVSLGKLEISQPIDRMIPAEINILNLRIPHIMKVQELAFYHRDPFDRMIIAQAISENMTVMTHDGHFKMYDVDLI